MPDETTPVPSTETVPEAPPIDTWSESQLASWRLTGNPPKTADPAPAKEHSEPAADKAAPAETPAPDSDPEDKQEPARAPRRHQSGEERAAELRADIQELLRQRAELRADATKPADKPAEPAPAKVASGGKPKLEDYPSYEDFIEALAGWKYEERDTARRQAETASAISNGWDEKVKAAKAAKSIGDDFDAALKAADSPLTEVCREAILTSDRGPEIADYLIRNPDEAERIAALSPVASVRELGKLEAQISSKKPPEIRKQTAASKPPTELATAVGMPEDEAAAAVASGDFTKYSRVLNSRKT